MLDQEDNHMTKKRETISACAAALMLAGPAYLQSGPQTPSPPVVSLVSPDHAPNSGVSGVVITGSNFTGATQVLFGANAASFTVDSDSQITANLGSVGTTGWVDVSVTSSSGTGTLVSGFDYFVPPEVIAQPWACGNFLAWSGSPTLGQSYTVTVPGVHLNTRLLVSWSNKRPVLRPFNGCVVLFAPDYHVALSGTPTSHTFSIPNDTSLIGVHLKTQAIVRSGGFPGPVFSFATQALDAVIGE